MSPQTPAANGRPVGATPGRPPVSTYRLQFHRGFTFADATVVVPYLARLGITDCYASPYLKACAGSTHGYDICDHTQLNPEVGSDATYEQFSAVLTAHGMGHVADVVPNHMAADEGSNAWWRDVLENGPSSPYAAFFDIDWSPVKTELQDKVLLPILGDPYGAVLERGELRLDVADGVFRLHYFEHNLPVNPRQLMQVLTHDLDTLRRRLGETDPQLIEYLSIITALRNLPAYIETDPQRMGERQREKEVARERLHRLLTGAPHIAAHVAAAVRAFNGVPGYPESFDRLHALLELQAYRLAFWRTAAHEINYRRFFDINQLAGIRMNEPAVFDAAHRLLLRLIGRGAITGLRIDHIDGLYAPGDYLERLQAEIGARCGSTGRFYVAVEKILSPGETLSDAWPVAGTSGYDFLNDVNGLFVDRRKRRILERIYRRFSRQQSSFGDLAYAGKKHITDTSMASELNVLAHALNRLSERDRHTRDFTLNSLRDALQEVIACFPIYRTYVTPGGSSEDDRRAVATAVRRARHRNPTTEPSIFEFVRRALLPDPAAAGVPEEYRDIAAFAMRFQQYTGPVQAKGIEDTAFYRYNVLLSLNDVGGDPAAYGTDTADFHAANRRRRERWPLGMLATSTHDTKRGEDVRARLNVLSEIPAEWGHLVSAWARLNNASRSIVDGVPAPSRNDEWLFYQTLVGVWPPTAPDDALPDAQLVDRVRDYLLKAAREAKVHTSWITQNQGYEAAVARFVERTLTGPAARRFLASFTPFQRRVARLGMINSLAQIVLKVASPGVADFYQGSELWDLHLVDPDNRRPVDYATRQQILTDLEPLLARPERADAVRQLLMHWPDGRIKLFVTASALRLRRQFPAVFLDGTYEPLDAVGDRAEHVVAFARRSGSDSVLAVVPRLVTELTSETRLLPIGEESWGETTLFLPAHLRAMQYWNLFTGDKLQGRADGSRSTIPLASVLTTCPVALLVSGAPQEPRHPGA
jgi:(1->4)-alpha-D-glucan 1-alpha-D-glucosylmutase